MSGGLLFKTLLEQCLQPGSQFAVQAPMGPLYGGLTFELQIGDKGQGQIDLRSTHFHMNGDCADPPPESFSNAFSFP